MEDFKPQFSFHYFNCSFLFYHFTSLLPIALLVTGLLHIFCFFWFSLRRLDLSTKINCLFQFYLSIVFVVFSDDTLYFCVVSCEFSFVLLILVISVSPFFLVCLDKGLSTLSFTKNQLLVSLIFSILLFSSVSFISPQTFRFSFLLLTLIYVYLYFSS